MATRRKHPLPPPSLPTRDQLLAIAWQHLDRQHPNDRDLWIARTWVTGDRASAFLTFALGSDLRMRVYDATSGRLLVESPPYRARKKTTAAPPGLR